jgi:AraC-like DNA-binding protein
MSGYDEALLNLARSMVSEGADDYRNGPLFWSEVASAFIDGLVTRHTSGLGYRARGAFGKELLDQLKDYVVAHLDEPIEVAALARIAGRSPFHFTRLFTRSVGMSRTVMLCICDCSTRSSLYGTGNPASLKLQPGQDSLTRVTCRAGFGAFMGSPLPNWPPEQESNSKLPTWRIVR